MAPQAQQIKFRPLELSHKTFKAQAAGSRLTSAPMSSTSHTMCHLTAQHEQYEHFSAKAAMLAQDRGIELKEPNAMKKMMMWGSIKLNTLTDNSRAHIADMMVQGTVMGVTSLRTTASEMPREENEEIIALLEEMIAAEEEFEKKWKSFL